MRILHRLAVLVLVVPGYAVAADLGAPPALSGQCPAPVYATTLVLDQADPGAILLDVQHMYSHAIEVSQRQDIIFSPSQAYTWAEATKLSCGKAIGYLRSRELDALQLNECDCFYRRMTAQLR